MKLFYTLLFTILSFNAHAQYYIDLVVNFDTPFVQGGGWRYDSTRYTQWLNIDTVHYKHNQWQVGAPHKSLFSSAFTTPNVIVTDTANTCLPNDTSMFTLNVPKAAWLALRTLGFRYQLDIDTGDKVKIEVSIDTGLHWIDAMNDSLIDGLQHYGNLVPTHTWDTLTIANLSNMLIWDTSRVGVFSFRFTLITDSSTRPRDGWMMDNFSMFYPGEGVTQVNKNTQVKIYPNPAQNYINITAIYTIRDISIINVLGQTVLRKTCHTASASLDIGDLPKGIYLIKVDDTTQRFVKD